MNQVKILHTADLHIGAELSALVSLCESRQYEVLSVFKKITQLCIKQGVEICLISGDLFDSNLAAKRFIKPVLQYIEQASETRFFYVAGNHDPLDASSPLLSEKLPENLTVFGGEYQTVELSSPKVRIKGRSFTHSSMDFVETSPMPDDDYINLLLLHGDIGAVSSRYNPLSNNFIISCGADYVALGHIHKRTEIQKIGKTYVSYCGCPEGQGFDETDKKGVYIGTVSKGNCNLSFFPTSKRLHIVEKIDISSASSSDDAVKIILNTLKEKYGDNYAENLYKIILIGSLHNPEAIKTAQLQFDLSSLLYFCKIKSKITKKVNLKLLSSEPTLKGYFVKAMLERLNSADDSEKQKLTDALYLGLSAFDSEVAYSED